MNRILRLLALTLVIGWFALFAWSQDVPAIPHTFQSGDVIRANEMNDNFEALREAIADAIAPREGFSSIPPHAFAPQHKQDANFQGPGIGQAGACFTSGAGYLYAPIQLPHGAEIVEVTFVYEDSEPSGDLIAYLDRFEASDPVSPHTTIADFQSTGTPGIASETVDTGLEANIVDNSSYSYVVLVTADGGWTCQLDEALQIRGVSVGYRLP